MTASQRDAHMAEVNGTSMTAGNITTKFGYEMFNGYAVYLDPSMVETVSSMDGVATIEPNSMITYDYWDDNCEIQYSVPSWGLSRVNKQEVENVDGTYYYQGSSGEGTVVYTIDTGILITHIEFEDRAYWGTNVIDDNDGDGDGHGTHVTGTSIGVNTGLAKKATAVAVKILNDDGVGTILSAVQGIEWVVADHQEREANGENRSVANLSFGGAYSSTLNEAVDGAVLAGILFSVAAGNEDDDSCEYSPSSAEEDICVAATESNDQRAYYSNWGECVDIYAPGSSILSSWGGGDYEYAILSGTSMAAPHVSGVLAVLWTENPTASAAEIKWTLLELATEGVVLDAKEDQGTPNMMLWADYECTEIGNLSDFVDAIFVEDGITAVDVLEMVGALLTAFIGVLGMYFAQAGSAKGTSRIPETSYGALAVTDEMK